MLRHAHDSPDLLDMGTGGGEWLAALRHRPARTVATEAWPPNVEVAGARLRPLGITVVAVDAAPDNVEQRPEEERGRLPFPNASFSLVTNRHESFVGSEVARVLDASGVFLTQQVGGDYAAFYDALGLPRPQRRYPRWDRGFATRQLEAAELRAVEGLEGAEEIRFTDAGAFAWYLQAIPWIVDDFSISAYRPQLNQLHQRLQRVGPLRLQQPAFWLKAVKAV